MKRFMAMVLSMTLVGSVIAAQAQDTTTTATTKNVHKRPAPKKTGPTVSEQLNELKQAIDAQQQQIRQLSDQVQTRDQRIQQLEQRIDQSQSAAVQAQTKADTAVQQTAEQQQTVVALKSDVTDLKTTATNNAMTIQETQKSIRDALESPLAIHYKGITITPGGFLAAESVYRNRALGSDVNTPFNSVNMPGAGQNAISEFFGSGRQSRISMLAEGKLHNAKLSGYYEADFLSAGITSNNNESNSYTLRQRQAWGQAAFDNGWSFTGGQMWSLVTETKKGVDNRSEALPMTIAPQYTVGFSWARQYGVRLAKNFGNRFWLAASLEDSQTTLSASGNASNFALGSPGNGGWWMQAGDIPVDGNNNQHSWNNFFVEWGAYQSGNQTTNVLTKTTPAEPGPPILAISGRVPPRMRSAIPTASPLPTFRSLVQAAISWRCIQHPTTMSVIPLTPSFSAPTNTNGFTLMSPTKTMWCLVRSQVMSAR